MMPVVRPAPAAVIRPIIGHADAHPARADADVKPLSARGDCDAQRGRGRQGESKFSHDAFSSASALWIDNAPKEISFVIGEFLDCGELSIPATNCQAGQQNTRESGPQDATTDARPVSDGAE